MNMQKRGSHILREWLLLLGLLILLHVFLFFGWMSMMTAEKFTIAPMIWLMVGYILTFVVILFIFTRRLSRATSPRELKEAQEQGIVASAKVLDIKRTRWRTPRTRNFRLQVSPARYEYEMRVRVKSANAPEYEVNLAEYLAGDDVPTKGDTIPVKIHPQRSEIVVMARDKPA
jgi:uncharacterized membrane protein